MGRTDRAGGAFAVVCAAAALALAQPAPPLRLTRHIALTGVAGRIDHLAVDPARARLFVAALGNDTVEAIDLERGAVTSRITGLHHPQGLGFIAETNTLVVANADDPVVRYYDADTLKPVHEQRLGADCDNVRIDAAAKRVYVGYGDGAIAALDYDGRKVADVPVGAHPESFQLEARGPRMFVNVPDRGEVVVVDRAKNTVAARWKVAEAAANFPMAFDEEHGRLFVGCRRPARLLALDATTGAVTARADIVGDTDDLFYDNGLVYVIGGGGAITVVEAARELRAVSRIETAAGARTGLFIPPRRELVVAAPKRAAAAELLVFAVPR